MRLRKRALIILAVIALLFLAVFSLPGQRVLNHLQQDQRAGMLEQTLKLGIYRATKNTRQAVAESLGLIREDLSVESAEERQNLPEFQTLPGAKTAALTPSEPTDAAAHSGWQHSFGDATSAKFSSLDQINRDNVSFLSEAWRYAADGRPKNIQATPIYTGRAVIFPDTSDAIVAVDPKNGTVLWKFEPNVKEVARRGLAYVAGDGVGEGRIYFTASGRIFALDAATGMSAPEFNGGSVSLGYQSRIAPMIIGDKLVTASYKPALHVIDLKTGDVLLEVDYFDLFDERGALSRFLSAEPDYAGANPWGGIAVDVQRQIAFLSTSNPTPVGVGIHRPGDNKPTVSIVAISIETGALLWSFQEVRHDLWDLDIASPPVLTAITREDKSFDAVAIPTKSGNLLLLDRLTGAPVFDFRLRRAPVSRVPGEITAPYQPDPELPQPFGSAVFNTDTVTDIGEENRASVLAQIDGASLGFFPPHVPDIPTVFIGLHGGAMHFGAALDPRSSVIYVASSHIPSMFTITNGVNAVEIALQGQGAAPYTNYCSACHGEKFWGGDDAPSLLGVAQSFDSNEFQSIIRNGLRAMPAFDEISDAEITDIYAMLAQGTGAANGGEHATPERAAQSYSRTAYKKLNDFEGYPGSKPPWGTLSAINLNTGRKQWQVPLGRYDTLMDRGLSQTGTENFSGPIVTAGGLIFASGTKDKLIRAFDVDTGDELWEALLPHVGSSSPMTYMHEGVQYVVIPATGGGTLALYDETVETGRSFIAFSVP